MRFFEDELTGKNDTIQITISMNSACQGIGKTIRIVNAPLVYVSVFQTLLDNAEGSGLIIEEVTEDG